MNPGDLSVENVYQRRVEQFSAAEQWYAGRERLVVKLRVLTFLAATVLVIVGWNAGHACWWYLAAGLGFGVFFAVVAYHEQVRRHMRRNALLREINQHSIARLHRNWTALPETRVGVPAQHRAVADDLDLFGHASLFHLLNVACTPLGIRTLRDWLLEPASPEVIRRRQQATVELAPQIDLRQTLNLEGRLLADRGRVVDQFVQWAASKPWLTAKSWLLSWCRGSAIAVLLTLVLACSGILSAELAGVLFLVLVALNVVTTVLWGGKVHNIFISLNLRCGEATRYLRMFELMYSMPGSSVELDAVKSEATRLGGGVLLRMRQWQRAVAIAMIRHVPFLFWTVYLPLQAMFLYDFHALNLLESWQARYGQYVRRWFLALGQFESLCSLAMAVHDHPHWTMPEVDVSSDRLLAVQLGHPLLPPERCVANDVEIGPTNTLLLVTGSNMSGKSTLLRAVGVNVALAQAGAPVCAEKFTMPPVTLGTSMQIHDSLEAGVSFYMAELMRLKEIVDLSRDAASRGNRVLLYLLDEILLGTNSRERHIAVVRVLEHLLHHGAIGAVSTHDLDLAISAPLMGACRCVHFRETLHDRDSQQPMTFDYRLRQGIVTTSNALKLLEIVGLEAYDGLG